MSPAGATSPSSAPSPPVRALMQRVVDYAGLFPPASLDMAAAVADYAEHRGGPHAWALGRFVLPAARLDEFDRAAAARLPRDGAHSWALSALLGSEPEEDLTRIERFNEGHSDARRGAVLVDTVELKVHSPREAKRAGDLLDRRFDAYLEVPVADDPADLIDAIAETRAKAKVRTGGVTADAFPGTSQLARFITHCVRAGVSFKATAGLHHPWRNEYRLTDATDAAHGTMFGFLNVLLAVAAAHAGLGPRAMTGLLEEREPAAVQFHAAGARWRDHELDMAALARARDTMAAFGSCSFREPIGDLQATRLL